jgi:hypothetical protein
VEADESQTRAPIARSGNHSWLPSRQCLITPDADFRSCQRFRQGILWLMAKRAVTSRHYLAEVWRVRQTSPSACDPQRLRRGRIGNHWQSRVRKIA